MHAVDLPRPWGASRGRDAQPDLGVVLTDVGRDGALADGRRAGEDRQPGTVGSRHQAVKRASNLADQQTRSQLAGAGIAIDAQMAPLARLSGGQRARLAMLLLKLAAPNFYLLDEPTNHLDIDGQNMLENELIEHNAACLLVSHDRAFVRAIATRIWVIKGKQLVEIDDPEPVFTELMAH